MGLLLTSVFDEAELKALEDPNRTPAFGWFVGHSPLVTNPR